MQRKETWLKFRHKLVTWVLRPFFEPYIRWRYQITIEEFKEQGDLPFLIIMNHQTAFDQFFVSAMFYRPIYFVASEHLMRKGFATKLLMHFVKPIIHMKGRQGAKTVKQKRAMGHDKLVTPGVAANVKKAIPFA